MECGGDAAIYIDETIGGWRLLVSVGVRWVCVCVRCGGSVEKV